MSRLRELVLRVLNQHLTPWSFDGSEPFCEDLFKAMEAEAAPLVSAPPAWPKDASHILSVVDAVELHIGPASARRLREYVQGLRAQVAAARKVDEIIQATSEPHDWFPAMATLHAALMAHPDLVPLPDPPSPATLKEPTP